MAISQTNTDHQKRKIIIFSGMQNPSLYHRNCPNPTIIQSQPQSPELIPLPRL